jgi:hypothetical protein
MSLALNTIRPRPTDRNSLYTIHKGDNTIYANKPPNELVMISVVSFKRREDAHLIATMLEEYKLKTGEWPPLQAEDENMWLPTANNTLRELEILQWDKTELDQFCVLHIFDLITITSVDSSVDGYKIRGDTYRYQVPDETYHSILLNKYQL